MLLVDLERRLASRLSAAQVPWEIDAIRDGSIYGRVSPLTEDAPFSIAIDRLVAEQPGEALVEDDGWWLLDAERQPLPAYDAVSVSSSGGSHTLTFVPDLRPFKDNPFLRFRPPSFALLVDGRLLKSETRQASAWWLDAPGQEGRFLVIGERIFDLMPAGCFDPAAACELPLVGADDFPLHYAASADTYTLYFGDGLVSHRASELAAFTSHK